MHLRDDPLPRASLRSALWQVDGYVIQASCSIFFAYLLNILDDLLFMFAVVMTKQ